MKISLKIAISAILFLLVFPVFGQTTDADATRFASYIDIEVDRSRGAGMPVTFDRQGFYKTNTSYRSGTHFRIHMTNQYSAYVYVFAADSGSESVARIFPAEGSSPLLGVDRTIILPRNGWIRMDDNVGTDYLIVLFSKQELDIDEIEKRFANEKGTFPERVARAVGSNFIPYSQVQYHSSKLEFSAVTANQRSVFGLLLAIDHI